MKATVDLMGKSWTFDLTNKRNVHPEMLGVVIKGVGRSDQGGGK